MILSYTFSNVSNPVQALSKPTKRGITKALNKLWQEGRPLEGRCDYNWAQVAVIRGDNVEDYKAFDPALAVWPAFAKGNADGVKVTFPCPNTDEDLVVWIKPADIIG